jgi:hypothetical protein
MHDDEMMQICPFEVALISCLCVSTLWPGRTEKYVERRSVKNKGREEEEVKEQEVREKGERKRKVREREKEVCV